MSAYTVAEKIQIVQWRHQGNSLSECVNLFIVAFENRPTPNKMTIQRIMNHFQKYGCLRDCRKCHSGSEEPPQENIDDDIERRDIMVCSTLAVDDTRSTRDVAEEMDVSNTTVHRIWNKHGLKYFRYARKHEIFPNDPLRRAEF